MTIRRAYIHNGKMEYYSPQNVIVCLIVACAPLQTLTIIAESGFAYIYGVPIFTLLYAIVFLFAFIINIIYMYNYLRHFDSKRIPMEYERRWRLGKMKYWQAAQHREPVDEKFS